MPDFSRFKDLAVSDTGFIFDPYSGATFTVNETGLNIVLALREGSTIGEVVSRLRAGFDAAAGDVAEDVRDFLRSLAQHGLLPEDFQAK